MHKLVRTALILVVSLGFSAVAAYADSVTVTYDLATQSVAPGGTLSFYATIAADAGNSNPIYLNGDSFDFGSSPIAADDSGFYANFPATLNPGDSVNGLVFTATLESGAMPGVDYSAIYELQGGVDGNDQTVLGAPQFTITALVPSTATPEPSSLVLLSTGLATMLASTKRRLRSTRR